LPARKLAGIAREAVDWKASERTEFAEPLLIGRVGAPEMSRHQEHVVARDEVRNNPPS
jgi:hypothetical protein